MSTFYIPTWCALSLFKDSITFKTSRNIKSDTPAREADMLTVHLHLSLGFSKSHPPISCQLWKRTPATAPSSPMHHLQWITQIFSSKFIAFFISSHRNLTTHYFVPASINTPQELTGKKWAILSRESSRLISDLSIYVYSFKFNLPTSLIISSVAGLLLCLYLTLYIHFQGTK